MPQQDLPNDLTDERLDQLDGYANSYRTGGVGEQELAKRIKLLTEEVRRLRKKVKTS